MQLLIICFIVGPKALTNLSQEAGVRLYGAFKPKSHRCYTLLCRTLVAFVIYMKVKLCDFDCSVILSFLELVAKQQASVHMLANIVAAIKAKFSIYCLETERW